MRTTNTEEHSSPSKTAAAAIAVLEHLEHGTHLLACVVRLIFDYDELVLGGTIDFNDTVP